MSCNKKRYPCQPVATSRAPAFTGRKQVTIQLTGVLSVFWSVGGEPGSSCVRLKASNLFTSILVLVLLTGIGCRQEVSPVSDLDRVLMKNAETIGGVQALEDLQVVWTKINERVFFVRKKPHFILVLVMADSTKVAYAEGFNGVISWEQADGSPRYETTGRPRSALWHTTQIPSPLVALYQLPQNGHRVRYVGIDSLNNTAYHRLLVTLDDGWESDYYVNVVTGRLERSRNVRRFHATDENLRRIETIWSDFRDVDGLQLPFTLTEIDLETGEELSSGTPPIEIRTNVEIPDEAFGLAGDRPDIQRLIQNPRPAR